MLNPMKRHYIDARAWLLIAALCAGTLLAGAHAFETFGRYEPCELCYRQRDVHWVAFWVAAIGYISTRAWVGIGRPLCALVAVVFGVSTALATYHAGVEWRWWPGPAACTASHFKGVSAADMANLLKGATHHVVACDDAAWRMLGISMAGYNALISAVLSSASAVMAYRGRVSIGRADDQATLAASKAFGA
jgi:disulfide bond formation protein DsbB